MTAHNTMVSHALSTGDEDAEQKFNLTTLMSFWVSVMVALLIIPLRVV